MAATKNPTTSEQTTDSPAQVTITPARNCHYHVPEPAAPALVYFASRFHNEIASLTPGHHHAHPDGSIDLNPHHLHGPLTDEQVTHLHRILNDTARIEHPLTWTDNPHWTIEASTPEATP